MPSLQHIDEVNAAIEKGRLKIAFKKLKDLFPLLEAHQMADDHCKHLQNRFILLSGEFHFNDEKELLKLSEEAFTEVNRNRITSALIEMTTEIGEIINKKEFSDNGNGQVGAATKSTKEKVVVEITLHDKELANFSAEERDQFFDAMAGLLKMDKAEIVIKSIKSGSVKITLELDEDKARELVTFIYFGKFPQWGDISFEITNPYGTATQALGGVKGSSIGFKLENGVLDLRRVNLKGANLRRVNLKGADLRRVKLRGVNLNEADLSEADLSGINLRGAKLRETILVGAKLIRADLTGAKLWRAQLMEADLEGAILERTNLWRAKLIGANLKEANLKEAYLKGAYLMEAKLERSDLSEADLSEADLSEVDLSEVDLSEVNLRGAIFNASKKTYLEEIGVDTTVINFIDDDNSVVDMEVEIDA